MNTYNQNFLELHISLPLLYLLHLSFQHNNLAFFLGGGETCYLYIYISPASIEPFEEKMSNFVGIIWGAWSWHLCASCPTLSAVRVLLLSIDSLTNSNILEHIPPLATLFWRDHPFIFGFLMILGYFRYLPGVVWNCLFFFHEQFRHGGVWLRLSQLIPIYVELATNKADNVVLVALGVCIPMLWLQE